MPPKLENKGRKELLENFTRLRHVETGSGEPEKRLTVTASMWLLSRSRFPNEA
jgi:hypothetical protein